MASPLSVRSARGVSVVHRRVVFHAAGPDQIVDQFPVARLSKRLDGTATHIAVVVIQQGDGRGLIGRRLSRPVAFRASQNVQCIGNQDRVLGIERGADLGVDPLAQRPRVGPSR